MRYLIVVLGVVLYTACTSVDVPETGTFTPYILQYEISPYIPLNEPTYYEFLCFYRIDSIGNKYYFEISYIDTFCHRTENTRFRNLIEPGEYYFPGFFVYQGNLIGLNDYFYYNFVDANELIEIRFIEKERVGMFKIIELGV